MDLDSEITRYSWASGPFKSYSYDGSKSAMLPPEEFLDEIGISCDEANEIAELNDNGHSFEEIADWIEVNL